MVELSLKEIVNLPTFTGTLEDSAFVVGVVNGTTAAKIPAISFRNTQLLFQQTPPSTPGDSGAINTISWDDSGIYSFYNGSWGKTPRVLSNWSDFSAHSRFLLVSSAQQLSENEIQTTRSNLGIGAASSEKEGLIRIATSMEDNTGSVPTAAVIKQYVDDAIKNISPAGSEGNVSLGDYSGPVKIKSITGEVILEFDVDNNILIVGKGVSSIHMQPDNDILIKDSNNNIRSKFDTAV